MHQKSHDLSLDQCALQASQSEQYVTMDIPTNLVTNWKREGYTHLHLGGVRLILTLHGRKGLPITARIGLLDTRFKQYQHAVIGTVLTTLHAGSVLLTFYLNFNVSLEDPNLPTTLKVQIQLQAVEQTSTFKIATLHHQIVYRLQNHALDLLTAQTSSDALMILADIETIPTIIQIPKQIQKQELLQLMPKPVQTSQAVFERRPDGQVKLSFQTPDKPNPNSPRLSYIAMITAVSTRQESDLPIYGFSSEGYPVYPDKVNGHFIWDVPEAHMCNPECPCLDDIDDDEDFEIMRKRRKKKTPNPKTPCRPYPSGPPDDPESDQPLPIYKKALRQIKRESSSKPVQPQIKSCLMFHPLDNHTKNHFLPSKDTQTHKPKLFLNPMSNHQSQALEHQSKLARIDAEKAQPSLFTKTQSILYTPSKQSTYDQFFGLSHPHSTNPNIPPPKPTSPRKPKSKVKISKPPPKEDLQVLEDSPKATPEPPKKENALVYQYHYQQIDFQNNNSDSTSEESLPSTYNLSSSEQTSSDSESQYADISGLLMATKTEDPSTSTPIVDESSDDNNDDQGLHTEPAPSIPPISEKSSKPSSSPWFTFDNIPRHKWQARHQEFAAWIDVQMTSPNAQSQNVLREFCSRFTGSL
ncbi:hypothetical protein KPL70_014222 [Citrus sinensis]|nr:hypothetical protein KPL70_014222 [Citrus sinensis]